MRYILCSIFSKKSGDIKIIIKLKELILKELKEDRKIKKLILTIGTTDHLWPKN
jgi:hypothetical protein